jgi:hypothetical protein
MRDRGLAARAGAGSGEARPTRWRGAWQAERRQPGRGLRGGGACAVRQCGAKELLTL